MVLKPRFVDIVGALEHAQGECPALVRLDRTGGPRKQRKAAHAAVFDGGMEPAIASGKSDIRPDRVIQARSDIAADKRSLHELIDSRLSRGDRIFGVDQSGGIL